MPADPRPGKTAKYVELPEDLAAAFVAFARSRGSDFTEQLTLAMRRHLAYPPPVHEIPPFEDAPKIRKKARPSRK